MRRVILILATVAALSLPATSAFAQGRSGNPTGCNHADSAPSSHSQGGNNACASR